MCLTLDEFANIRLFFLSREVMINVRLLLLCLCLSLHECMGFLSHSFAPSAVEVIGDDVVTAIDALRNAAVPISLGSAFAISISEAVAGAVGGFASRRTAAVIGDKKKDKIVTKLQTTSAYFISRSIFFRISLIIGLPRPLARFTAAILASVVSEGAKARSRSDNLAGEKLETPEILHDIIKWLVYDGLDAMMSSPSGAAEEIGFSLLFGAVAGLCGALTKDLYLSWHHFRAQNKASIPPVSSIQTFLADWHVRYPAEAVEGGVLFGCYQLVTEILAATVPQSLTTKFLFDQGLEALEDEVKAAATALESEL